MEQERLSAGPKGSSSLVGVMDEAVVPSEVSSDGELKGPLSDSGEDSISPGPTAAVARVSVEPSKTLRGQEKSQTGQGSPENSRLALGLVRNGPFPLGKTGSGPGSAAASMAGSEPVSVWVTCSPCRDPGGRQGPPPASAGLAVRPLRGTGPDWVSWLASTASEPAALR